MRGLSKDGLFFTHPGLSASVAAIDMLQQSSNNLAVLWKQLYYLILWPLLGPETWHWHCYFGNRISVLGTFLRVSISNRARAPGSASATPCLHQHLSRKIQGPLCPSGARLWSPVLIFGSCLPPFSWHLPKTCTPGVELVAISKSHQWNLKCSNLDLLILARQASRVSFYPCCCCCCCLVARHVQFFVVLCTVAHQAPLSIGFLRKECWSGLPLPFLGNPTMLLFSLQVLSDFLRPHGLQHAELPCPSLSLGVCSNSCPLSWWCHPIISSVTVFSLCPQSFPTSGSFPMSWLFASDGQSIGASAPASALPVSK